MICPRLQAPIVLAHGLFGFVRIGMGPVTLATYFRGIPDWLRAGGNRVLVTRVHPTAGVTRRGLKLGERIDAEFPNEPVHVIGHSMGGLDARRLLADPAWSSRILSLTTIGTPHLGSVLAHAAQSNLRWVYRLMATLGLDHRGFFDVVPATAREWHLMTPTPRHIPCFSVAGSPPVGDVSWPLRKLHLFLMETEGPNDGLVSVESASAFGVALDTSPADHFHQMNWLTGAPKGSIGERTRDLYAGVIDNLVRLGFEAHDAHDPAEDPAIPQPAAVND